MIFRESFILCFRVSYDVFVESIFWCLRLNYLEGP